MLEQTKKFNSGVKLYMFQTGTLKTKLKYIKMNQSNEDFEIPVPWFLIKHPEGDVVIDGGNAIEVAIDKHTHWGAVLNAYDPVMKKSENCVEQAKSVGTNIEDVRYLIQSHLHLDHSGGVGRFPNAIHVVQRLEYDYAFNPDWFASLAYIRKDFDNAFKKVDVLLTPTCPTTAFLKGDFVNDPLSMYLSDLLTVPANLAGLPAISIPCGFDTKGLPIGLQLIGNVLEEDRILNAANIFEIDAQVIKNRPLF